MHTAILKDSKRALSAFSSSNSGTTISSPATRRRRLHGSRVQAVRTRSFARALEGSDKDSKMAQPPDGLVKRSKRAPDESDRAKAELKAEDLVGEKAEDLAEAKAAVVASVKWNKMQAEDWAGVVDAAARIVSSDALSLPDWWRDYAH